MKHCLHIYTGDGKGKTTAAVGLATRYLGHGGSVLFLQFMKGRESGEVSALTSLGAEVRRLSKDYGFFPFPDADAILAEHTHLLDEAALFAKEKGGLLILDEIISAYTHALLPKEAVLSLLAEKPCEIICTGRDVPEELLRHADYVTEMCARRHPYETGLCARRGIEF